MLTPGLEHTIKQSLRLMLGQTQYAMVAQDSELYRHNLSNIRTWLQRFAVPESGVVQVMLEEINELSEIDVNPSLPNLGNSLSLISQFTPD